MYFIPNVFECILHRKRDKIFEGCCLAAENLCAVVVCVFCEDGAVKMYTISGCAGHLQLIWGCSTVMDLSHKITEK